MRCVIQIIIKILHSRNSWQLAKILKWNWFEINFQKTQACNDVYCGGLFINQTHTEETVESAVSHAIQMQFSLFTIRVLLL